jgi:glutamate racemase
VIGTEATVKSTAYTKAIQALDAGIKVFGYPCPLFVPLVEEGWVEGKIASLIARKYLDGLKNEAIDTIVLGCTHYPLLKNVIAEVMGEEVRLIDSAVETLHEIKRILEARSLNNTQQNPPIREFFVTDSTERFLKVGEHFLGQKIEHIEKIAVGI